MDKSDQQATQDIAKTGSYIRTYAKDLAAAKANPHLEPEKSKSEPSPKEEPAKEPEQQAPESSVDAAREAVLARLRSSAQQAPAAPVPPPTFAEPIEAVVPRIPVIQKEAAPVPPPPPPPPLPPPPAPAPAAPPPPKPPIQPEGPSALHTYSTDFSDKLDREGASTFSVLAAEGNTARQEPAPVRTYRSRNRVVTQVAFGVLVAVLASAGVYGIYLLVTGKDTPILTQAPSLVFADERRELTGPDFMNDLAALSRESLVAGTVLVTYIAHDVAGDDGLMREPQPGGALLQALDLGAPDILLRNTDPLSTVGIIHAEGETRPFFVLRVTSFERTFAGMLAWEADMADDLAPIYPPGPAAATSASSTATTTAAAPLQPRFRDEVVENHDVRVLRDESGRSRILYGYRDKTTLIIARNEAAYLELVRRLEDEAE